jgi:hypothetical protein
MKNTLDKEKPYATNVLINENQTATGSVSGAGTAPRSTKSSNENYEKCKKFKK